MSLTELGLELNQQLVEALAERDRLRDRIAEMESFQLNYEHAVTIEREDWKQDRDRLQKDRHALVRAIDPMSETAAAERSTKSLVECAEYFHEQRKELAAMRKHIAELQDNVDAKSEGIDILRLDRAQWAETAHRLREALLRHGRHDLECPMFPQANGLCTCGLEVALNPPAGEPKPGEGK